MTHLNRKTSGAELQAIRSRVGLSRSALLRLTGLTERALVAFEGQGGIDVPPGHPAAPLVAVYDALAGVIAAAEAFRRAGGGVGGSERLAFHERDSTGT